MECFFEGLLQKSILEISSTGSHGNDIRFDQCILDYISTLSEHCREILVEQLLHKKIDSFRFDTNIKHILSDCVWQTK